MTTQPDRLKQEIRFLGCGGMGEATLFQKGSSPTKYIKHFLLQRGLPPQSLSTTNARKKAARLMACRFFMFIVLP